MEAPKRPIGRPRKNTETAPLPNFRPAALPTLAGALGPADLARIVRTREACLILGVGRTTLHRMTQTGRLPPALRISERARGWRLETLIAAQQEVV